MSVISIKHWPTSWETISPQHQLIGIGVPKKIWQSARELAWSDDEGHHGIFQPYILDIPHSLWGRDVLAEMELTLTTSNLAQTKFLGSVTTPSVKCADPITWITSKPVWVNQWPITGEKLHHLNKLVQEQLELGHIQDSNSPWNTPIFLVPKKSGKWRLVHDLRKVNEQMINMGTRQPGIPSPSPIPMNWNLIVIDLKDCFFHIPLSPVDCHRFAFSVPSINFNTPFKRYEWTV